MKSKYLLFSLLVCAVFSSAFGQMPDLKAPLPADPSVRTGKLPNGLTYYLKQNPKPEKRLLLQLAVNAGSVNENDSQQGLAHFVEHMCFNGTKSWKKNDLINMLETMGVRFGDGLNAFTGYDQTIYMLEIPTDNPDNIKKGFQVIEEWSHLVSMEDAEIEKERGVILEERRLGLGADERMRLKYEPVILKGSRYAERFIIGQEEILKTFPPDTLRSFYKTWYRPDNMALVVVGDLPVGQMEDEMKSRFAALPKAKGKLNRTEYDVPGNREPLVSVVTDKEAAGFSAEVFFKYPAYRIASAGDYRRRQIEQLYGTMLSKRLSEIGMKPDCPFMSASVYSSSFFSRNTLAFTLTVNAKENRIAESLDLVLAENERVRQHGFTQAELDREKKSILTNLDNAVKEADKVQSGTWASRFVSNFLTGGAMMNAGQTRDLVTSLLPGITLEEINRLANERFTDENIAAVVIAPEKDGAVVPAESDIVRLIRDARKKQMTPYVDAVTDAPLLATVPVPGQIAGRIDNPEAGYTEVTFSNGARVILKSTDFKNDEINFSAYSPGGLSVLPDQDVLIGQLAPSLMQQGGLGDFNLVALRKKLTGVRANVSPSLGELTENLNGFSTVKDFETLLQLNYLWFTNPRRDPEAFKTSADRLRNQIRNIRVNPMAIFQDSLFRMAYNRNPRVIVLPDEKMIDAMTMDRAYAIFTDRFRDASDFTFFLVGSFNMDEVMPLLQKYIGGLPSEYRKETWKDVDPQLVDHVIDVKLALNSEPQSTVMMLMNGKFDYNTDERLKFSIMMQTMNIKLREQMREEQGGVYGVSFSETLSKYPKEEFQITAGWGCAPEKADTLTQTVFGEIRRIRQDGPTETDLNKIKETVIKDFEKGTRENGFWMLMLQNHYLYGHPVRNLDQFKRAVDAVTIDDIRNTAVKYLNEQQYIRGVLMPKQ